MAADRTVRHLRLAVPSRAQAQQLLPRLEDALRCASLPDDGARLLVLRRLALGAVPSDISGPALARLIEQRVADGPAGGWVAADGPAADRAGGVVFASALAARTRLALQLLQGAPCRAWYWPLAVPEFQPVLGRGDNLRRLAWAVATLPEARSALPAWVAPLLQAGHGPALAALVTAEEGQALLREAGWSLPEAPCAAGPAGVVGVESHAEQGAVRAAAPGAAGLPAPAGASASLPAAPRSALPAWLQVLARAAGLSAEGRAVAAAGGPAAGAPPAAATVVAAAAGGPAGDGLGDPFAWDPVGGAPRLAGAADSGPSLGRLHRREALPVGGQPADTGEAAEPLAAAAPPLAAPPDAASASGEPSAAAAAPSAPAVAPPVAWAASEPTAAGGLLCLLPLLQHLGWPAWLAASGADGPACTAAVLGGALQRLGVAPDDPAWALAEAGGALAALSATAAPAPGGAAPAAAATPPAAWHDPRWALARCGRPGRPGHRADTLADQLAIAPDAPAQAALWLLACRRWLRRAGGIGLASLVLRPGRLARTPTHADVHFRLADTDLRVRRLGLDLDPGWLPWFGRVVAFHYRAADRP